MEPLLSFFLAWISITFSLLVLTYVSLGWGVSLARWLSLDLNINTTPLYLWLGFIGMNLATESVHLFIPIDWRVSALFGAMGLIGLISISRSFLFELHSKLKSILRKRFLLSFLLLIIYTLWCTQMLSGPINYDAGMYYFSSIRWLNEHPIIPGIANLFAQFGFNHSYFSYVALLNISPYANNHFALGGFFLLILSAVTLFTSGLNRMKFGWVMVIFLLIGLQVSAHLLASPAPDMIVGFVEIALFCYLAKQATEENLNQKNKGELSIIFLLAIHVVTIKLSAVMFAICCIALIIPDVYRSLKVDRRWCLRVIILGSMIFVVHIIRSYILSGYPLFPSTALGLNSLDWIAKTADAQNAAKVIYDYARNEGLPPSKWQSGWAWLPYWWSQQVLNHGYWISLTFGLIGFNGIILLWRHKNYADYKLLRLYLPLIGAIIFWFLTAPAWRFLGVIPYLTVGLATWLCIRAVFSESKENALSQTKPWGIFTILFTSGVISLFSNEISLTGWRPFPGILVDKNPTHPVAEVIIENKLTNSGLNIVFVPWFQCWNAPLPCTPLYNPQLHLRSYSQEVNSIRSGFSVNSHGQELRPKYQSTLENGIQFNKPGYPNFLTSVSGIGAVEPWGRWTNSSIAKFTFLYPLPKNFNLNINLLAFGPNVHQEIQIKVCDQSHIVIPSNKMERFILTFKESKPCSSLEIFIPHPISPHEINASDPDKRKLGLGIESLAIIDLAK